MDLIPDEWEPVFGKPAIATIATLLSDGHPQVTPVWVDFDGAHVLVVTRKGTQKHRNVERDPRVTVTVIDPDNLYRYLEVRGRVDRVTTENALSVSDRLAQRYWGVDEYPFARDTPRALLHIHPEHVNARQVPTPADT